MRRSLILALLCALALHAQTRGIDGKVIDARGGEPLTNVSVQILKDSVPLRRAISGDGGRFHVDPLEPGDYTLRVSTVGYHVVTQQFHVTESDLPTFEIVLSSDNLARTDTIDVSAGPFEAASDDSPSSLILAGTDVRNLASVLADDPLRAVQSLPGVTSNNDFDARFSLRGADYNRVGLYLDDVLLHAPFHMLQGQNVTGSSSAFNGSMVEQLELHEGAFPARFGGASAGVLDVHTRDGSHTAPTFRIEASASNAGVVAEGPFGKKKRGSWLVAARRSYLQYLISRISPGGTSLVFALEDVQARLAYDLTPKSKLTFYLLESYSSLDRDTGKLGINSLRTAGYNYTLANLGWQYTPTPKLVLRSRAAWMREKYDNFNPTPLPLAQGFYGEWVGNTSASWQWASGAKLDAGASMRRMRDAGFATQYQSATVPRLLDRWNGSAAEADGYVQQSFSLLRGVVHLTAGLHLNRHTADGVAMALPVASATIALTRSTRAQLGWGEYAQHQPLAILTSLAGGSQLLPLRSVQQIAAIEQRLGARTRFRAEFYNRADRDLAYRPLFEPRLIGNTVFVPPAVPRWVNSERGWARGVEVFLQRTSANKFSGWISWAFGRTGMRDGVTGDRFPADFDQRHTVSVYGAWRLRPSVHLSVHSSYGSGFPLPEYLTKNNGAYFLSASRNQLRMDYYARTDIRINKSWTRDRWKFVLYGEVINIGNRTNYLFNSLNSYNTKTGQASVSLDTMLPVIPSAGILIER